MGFQSFRKAFALATVVFLPCVEGGPKKADLSRLVVVGDSLTAGFQNFSLFDGGSPGAPGGGQQSGYASLVAKQAGVALSLPLITYPGIPPALKLDSGQVVRESGMGFRSNPLSQTFNLSVPGFTLANAISYPFPGTPLTNAIDMMSLSVLGVPNPFAPGCGPILSGLSLTVSEVQCAAALRPSTILVSLGNNDALGALTFGLPPTDPAAFRASYRAVMTTLSNTQASIAAANIPNVTALPFLVPVPVFQAMCPSSTLPAETTSADFVVPDITNSTATNFGLCATFAVRPAALIASAAASVTTFNAIIAEEAARVGAIVIDFNTLFNGIVAQGYTVGGRTLTVAPFGGLFSLDMIHPTQTGYAILANEAIKTLNNGFKTKIPSVDVGAIAANDPLVPKN